MQNIKSHVNPVFFSDIVKWFNVINVDYKLPPQFLSYIDALRDPRVSRYSRHKFQRDEVIEYLQNLLPHCSIAQINKLVSDCDNDFVRCTNRKLKQLNSKLSKNAEFQSMCNKRRKMLGRNDKSFFFYTPSLFVDNCVHAFRLSKSASVFDHEVLYDKCTYELSCAFITRFPNSYTDGKLHGECVTDINTCMFAKKAIQYARRHWKVFVLPPFATDTVMFADPRHQVDRTFGGAPVKYCVHVIKEPNPRSQCAHTLQNIGMTLEPHIVDEIRGGSGNGGGSVSYCMHCSGMLSKDSCVNCDISFKEEAFLCYGDGRLVHNEVVQFVKERETDIKTKYGITSDEPILIAITDEEHQQNKQRRELKREAERLAKQKFEEQRMTRYYSSMHTPSFLDDLDTCGNVDEAIFNYKIEINEIREQMNATKSLSWLDKLDAIDGVDSVSDIKSSSDIMGRMSEVLFGNHK